MGGQINTKRINAQAIHFSFINVWQKSDSVTQIFTCWLSIHHLLYEKKRGLELRYSNNYSKALPALGNSEVIIFNQICCLVENKCITNSSRCMCDARLRESFFSFAWGRGWLHCHSLLIVLYVTFVPATFRSSCNSGLFFTFLTISLRACCGIVHCVPLQGRLVVDPLTFHSHFIEAGVLKVYCSRSLLWLCSFFFSSVV